MGAQWSQFFPPRPVFTDADVPSQAGRVFIVTGGASGIGRELCALLYCLGGKVYIAGRSEANAQEAIDAIKQAEPTSKGALEFLYLELSDLSTIKPAADTFKEKESRLDVLWNNAGVSHPPAGSVSHQGIELQLATNCLGHFLLTQLLLPLLEATAASPAPPGPAPPTPAKPRVVWLSSQMAELCTPTGGLLMDEVRNALDMSKLRAYSNSKIGNWFLSAELARRSDDIVSVAVNPGAVLTNMMRYVPWSQILVRPLLYKPLLAAYAELFAALSPDVRSGDYVYPWGRVADRTQQRQDILDAMKLPEEGGTGRARDFWEWCEEKTRDYA